MYTLYCASGACSMAVHIVMKELGIDHDIQVLDVANGEHKKEAYLKINPRGQVASLKMPDDKILTQNVAMIDYLNEKYNGELMGARDIERARAMEWLMFANADLHGAYSKVMFAMKNGADDAFVKKACENVQRHWDLIESHLKNNGTEFLAGDKASAADIYTAVVANWQFIPHLPTFGPKTQALINTISNRESFQHAIEAENVTYKVAA